MQPFGASGTFYDSPPAAPIIFKVGSRDLEQQLGGGFQAAHIWVNNASNQALYLPDGPDLVPPGVTRVIAIQNTDVARASWVIPQQFSNTPPSQPAGAAIIIWLNGGVDISPNPGVANNPIVSIATGQAVVVSSGTVTIGPGSNTIGAISAVNSSVTVAGTVSIGNTPAVTISGTPTVNIGNSPTVAVSGTVSVSISSGSVSITGTPSINIQSQSVNVNTQTPQDTFGSFAVPNNGTNNSGNLTLAAGTNAIGVLVATPGLQTLQVQGVQTGQFYLQINATTSFLQGYFVSAVLSVIDTQVKVIGTTTAGLGPTTVYVAGLHGIQAVFIFDQIQEPASVELINESSGSRGARPGGQSMISVIPEIPTGVWTITNVSPPGTVNTVFALIAANSGRRGCSVLNEALGGSIELLAGTTTSFIIMSLPNGGYYEMPTPVYTGILDGFTDAAGMSNMVRVAEIT